MSRLWANKEIALLPIMAFHNTLIVLFILLPLLEGKHM